MSYNEIIILVGIVAAFAAIYAFGWVCWNQGHYAGYNDGFKVGYEQINLKDTSTLQDDACVKLFDEVMGKDYLIICPVCMDAPIAKGQGACNGCLCALYADDLPIGHSDEWKEWVDFGDDDTPARAADSDMPF